MPGEFRDFGFIVRGAVLVVVGGSGTISGKTRRSAKVYCEKTSGRVLSRQTCKSDVKKTATSSK